MSSWASNFLTIFASHMASPTPQLHIGSQVDIYDRRNNAWRIGAIIKEFHNAVLINKLSDPPSCNTWFNKQSADIAPLNSHTIPVIKIQLYYKLLSQWKCCIPSNKSIIMCTSNGIFKYDPKKDMFFDVNLHIMDHCSDEIKLAYDQINSLLYIIDIKHQRFCILNMKTNTITPYCIYGLDLQIRKSVFINHGTRQILHLFTNDSHLYFDHDQQKFIEFQSVSDGKFVYIPHQSRVLLFTETGCKESDGRTKFVKSKIKLPDHDKSCKFQCDYVDNIYGSLVVMFNFKCNKMYFLDIYTNKWFESDIQCPSVSTRTEIIDGKDDYLYFLSYPAMFKISWKDMMPKTLFKFYREKICKYLIYGFVKNIEEEFVLCYNVPCYLKELILLYYPCFLYC